MCDLFIAERQLKNVARALDDLEQIITTEYAFLQNELEKKRWASELKARGRVEQMNKEVELCQSLIQIINDCRDLQVKENSIYGGRKYV